MYSNLWTASHISEIVDDILTIRKQIRRGWPSLRSSKSSIVPEEEIDPSLNIEVYPFRKDGECFILNCIWVAIDNRWHALVSVLNNLTFSCSLNSSWNKHTVKSLSVSCFHPNLLRMMGELKVSSKLVAAAKSRVREIVLDVQLHKVFGTHGVLNWENCFHQFQHFDPCVKRWLSCRETDPIIHISHSELLFSPIEP